MHKLILTCLLFLFINMAGAAEDETHAQESGTERTELSEKTAKEQKKAKKKKNKKKAKCRSSAGSTGTRIRTRKRC